MLPGGIGVKKETSGMKKVKKTNIVKKVVIKEFHKTKKKKKKGEVLFHK